MDVEGFVRAYISAVESGATGDDLAAYYHVDFIQKEFPNRIVVRGAVRKLAGSCLWFVCTPLTLFQRFLPLPSEGRHW